MADRALRQAIKDGSFITASGGFDLISALIADKMGFKALYATGYGIVASSLGLPEAGRATYSQMIDRIGRIVEMTKTPVIADTGYGGLLNEDLLKHGTSTGAVPMYDFAEFSKLIGFEDIWDFERRYKEPN